MSHSIAADSLAKTAAWFLGGGLVTAVFSSSLHALTTHTSLVEVLATGMLVPSFTWAVHLAASALLLTVPQRAQYWADLARVCFWGSVALLPAAAANLALTNPPHWISIAIVLASVLLMAAMLFRLSARHGLDRRWPIAWCLTICLNMSLFLACSWHWWTPPSP